tara:strand:- start:1700 stop:1981 length:282 start_codon:yes stop_codon:yes gene_type:complete
MLSKQSLRSSVTVLINDEPTTKEQVIKMSESWSNNEELLFRKMLKQGGNFKMGGKSFKIIPTEQILNSKGNPDAAIKPMDIDNDNIDLNYIRK